MTHDELCDSVERCRYIPFAAFVVAFAIITLRWVK